MLKITIDNELKNANQINNSYYSNLSIFVYFSINAKTIPTVLLS